MSPLWLGAISILIIVFVFFTFGNTRDTISRVMVILGIAAIVLITLNFSALNYGLVTWLLAHPFFYALLPQK